MTIQMTMETEHNKSLLLRTCYHQQEIRWFTWLSNLHKTNTCTV